MRALLPSSMKEAVSMIHSEAEPPTPIAGGTDLLVHWPVNLAARARTYLDLSKLRELRRITWTPDSLILGALTTYWDVVRDERIGREFPMLVTAARQVGAVQIQTRGTWAGNIANASPAADGVPALMAYGALVEMTGDAAQELQVPLDRFYLGYKQMRRRPEQLITAIRVPRRPCSFQVFEKVGSRRAQTITKVGVAIACADGAWRVVANSMAPTVRRCAALERILDTGSPVRSPDDLLPAIRSDVSPIDDIRSTARYRERVMSRLVYHHLRGVHPAFA